VGRPLEAIAVGEATTLGLDVARGGEAGKAIAEPRIGRREHVSLDCRVPTLQGFVERCLDLRLGEVLITVGSRAHINQVTKPSRLLLFWSAASGVEHRNDRTNVIAQQPVR
jgi:hypothetical protein